MYISGLLLKYFTFKPSNSNSLAEQTQICTVKFVYSDKATKFCGISTLLLSTLHTDKSKVEISQNFVAFSEYMNFKVEKILKGSLYLIPSPSMSREHLNFFRQNIAGRCQQAFCSKIC